MTAEPLLREFERVAEAADAIPRLRRLVLDLAVRGWLVQQDPEEDSVTKLRRSPPPDVPFQLPDTWSWQRVSEIGKARLGKMLDKAKNRGAPKRYLRNINVRWFDFDLSDVKSMPFEEDELAEFALHDGDVLICEGGEPGRAAVWDGRERGIYFQKALHRVRLFEGTVPKFFVLFLRASADAGRLVAHSTGETFQHLTGQSLAALPVPLPPVAEQHRIVAKVDELMALCDQLEASQKQREVSRDGLRAASLHRLAASDGDGATSAGDVRFFLHQSPRLITKQEHVAAVRQTILDLAVHGRLAPQDPGDEPASELLGTRVTTVDPDVALWSLPAGWAWSCLAQLGEQMGGGTPSKSNPDFWIGSIPWVSPKDMKVDLILDACDHVSTDGIAASATRLVPVPALLMVVRGMILAHSFPTALSGVPLTMNQDMKALIPYRVELAPMLLLLTKGMKPQVMALVQHSTHGTCRLNTAELFGLTLPIPPLAEQHRIVAKVDELMEVCDELEAALASAQDGRGRLLEALLHEALEGAGVPELMRAGAG